MKRADYMKDFRPARVVIKIGTSLITNPDDQAGVSKRMLALLNQEILFLRNAGIPVMLVTSGAVGTGRHLIQNRFHMETLASPSVSRRQALSALGQHLLYARYADAFGDVGIPVAQLLITARDFRDRRAYLNIGHTIQELLRLNALPIVNENDTVSTEELQFGENDILSAACAALFQADLLVILTSVEGFLFNGERVSHLETVTDEHRRAAGGPAGPGSGGMQTKLRAGELCMRSGAALAILPGHHDRPIQALFAGEDIGTLMMKTDAKAEPLRARKRWLLFSQTRGGVHIDAGATQALQNGSSLLPAGVRNLRGSFLTGDVIEIENESGSRIGRGIVNYSASEVRRMLGLSGSELKERRLVSRDNEIIHRDNLILE